MSFLKLGAILVGSLTENKLEILLFGTEDVRNIELSPHCSFVRGIKSYYTGFCIYVHHIRIG